jgi:excisionase family DNA binding protein
MSDNNRAYSIAEFSERFCISRWTTYCLIRDGKLRAVKLGRRTIILAPDVEAYVASLPGFKARPGDVFGHKRTAEHFRRTRARVATAP